MKTSQAMCVAPHSAAACSGAEVLREGGNAVEACVAMAASLSAVYPHMTGIGGDAFWLVREADGEIWAVDGAGRTPADLTVDWYRERGFERVPYRGGAAANTVAGAVSTWQRALERAQGRMPLGRLFADAVRLAREGYSVSESQSGLTADKRDELGKQPGFAATYLVGGQRPPQPGQQLVNRTLADTFEHLARAGLDDFYRGELARSIAKDLEAAGSPVGLEALRTHEADFVDPLRLDLRWGTLFNLPPPTQGAASLAILGLFDRRYDASMTGDSMEYVHTLVEATKLAFRLRDRHLRDPQDMEPGLLRAFLGDESLNELAGKIDTAMAAPWGEQTGPGDTTWFGAADRDGRVVSCIQSIYHEFGSGVVLQRSGICWQNRGCSFSLNPKHFRMLRPGRKPFHTLNPALAELNDGRVLAYGAMGGDGQPQTQAAVFTRHVVFGQPVQTAIEAPRWLLGRTWGDDSANNLRLEGRFDAGVVDGLRERGHDVTVVGDFEPMMGHAGAVVRHRDGAVEGSADPRSDGTAVIV